MLALLSHFINICKGVVEAWVWVAAWWRGERRGEGEVEEGRERAEVERREREVERREMEMERRGLELLR